MCETVWVVIGRGRYAEDGTWVVCTYGDECQAKLHVNALSRKVSEYKAIQETWDYEKEEAFMAELRCTLDPHIEYMRDGTFYVAVKTTLWRHFDEYQEAHGM